MTSNNDGTEQRKERNEWTSPNGFMTIFSAILMVTTIVQACFLFWANTVAVTAANAARDSAKAAQDSVELATDTAEVQLRAYVLVDYGKVTNIDGPGPAHIEIRFKNTGQTPAFQATEFVLLGCEPFPKSNDKAPKPEPHGTPRPIGAGNDSFITQDLKLTNEERSELLAGRRMIHIFGEVRYLDIFGKAWSLHFSLKQGGDTDVHESRMSVTEDGNYLSRPKQSEEKTTPSAKFPAPSRDL